MVAGPWPEGAARPVGRGACVSSTGGAVPGGVSLISGLATKKPLRLPTGSPPSPVHRGLEAQIMSPGSQGSALPLTSRVPELSGR